MAPDHHPWTLQEIKRQQHFKGVDKTIVPRIIIQRMYLELCDSEKNRVQIYTDGSKADTGAGYGLFCEELNVNESGKLPGSWSVFSTVRALKLIKRSRKTSFLILSDSFSALQAIEDIWTLNPLVQLVHSELKALNRKNIKFCWIPSHMGIKGNEKADEVARLGTQQQQVKHASLRIGTVFMSYSSASSGR